MLNNRIRKSGFSASEVTFARDMANSTNLTIKDEKLHLQNIGDRRRQPHLPPPPLHPGDLTVLKQPSPKHSPSDSFVVIKSNPHLSTVHKILHPLPTSSAPLKMAPSRLIIKTASLHKMPPHLSNHNLPSTKYPTPINPNHPYAPITPSCSPPSFSSDSDSSDNEDSAHHFPPPPLPPPPANPAAVQSAFLFQIRQLASANAEPRNILPDLHQLAQANRVRAQQSLLRPPPDLPRPLPPPPPPPPPPHPPPSPPLPSNRPPRQAKTAAAKAIAISGTRKKASSQIPQLEGAEPTPDTTPES